MNFKSLLKWIFVQNRSLNFEVYSTFSNALKFRILTFKRSFKWTFVKTKVVDLKILNNFGIQEFLIWGQENGEKLSLKNEVLEFRVIY